LGGATAGGRPLTAATDITQLGTHSWQASGPRDLSRLMKKARRHSSNVHALRIGIPAGAVLGLIVLAMLTWFNPLRALSNLPISPGKLVVSGTKITMEAPKLTGFTRDNRAYNLTAETAAQDFTNPTVLELTGIRAKIELQDKGGVDLTAVAGLYDTKAELLTLTKYIVFVASAGYQGYLTEAVFDTRKGYIVSEKPVEVQLPNGVLNASRLEVIDNGALLRFDGGVTMVLTPTDANGLADRKASGR
jgi:lipopolysaccharide export system protein LptC